MIKQQRIEIGAFNKMERKTYAECARITLSEPADDGVFSACTVDGILYISRKKRDGQYVIVSVNSTYDLDIRYDRSNF